MAEFHFLNKVQPPQVTSLNLPPNHSCNLVAKRKIVVRPNDLPILQPDGVLVKVISTDEYYLLLFLYAISLSLDHMRFKLTYFLCVLYVSAVPICITTLQVE
ncbi:uncharacterized protein L199_003144 [Kwoniella botswanensis]|uniref:uncharacterized protein n=1 Tax=Kwoniella botswanensis TaxID=1268659 RepID=UPI00315DD400